MDACHKLIEAFGRESANEEQAVHRNLFRLAAFTRLVMQIVCDEVPKAVRQHLIIEVWSCSWSLIIKKFIWMMSDEIVAECQFQKWCCSHTVALHYNPIVGQYS